MQPCLIVANNAHLAFCANYGQQQIAQTLGRLLHPNLSLKPCCVCLICSAGSAVLQVMLNRDTVDVFCALLENMACTVSATYHFCVCLTLTELPTVSAKKQHATSSLGWHSDTAVGLAGLVSNLQGQVVVCSQRVPSRAAPGHAGGCSALTHQWGPL